jgi:hypothetical protein
METSFNRHLLVPSTRLPNAACSLIQRQSLTKKISDDDDDDDDDKTDGFG